MYSVCRLIIVLQFTLCQDEVDSQVMIPDFGDFPDPALFDELDSGSGGLKADPGTLHRL